VGATDNGSDSVAWSVYFQQLIAAVGTRTTAVVHIMYATMPRLCGSTAEQPAAAAAGGDDTMTCCRTCTTPQPLAYFSLPSVSPAGEEIIGARAYRVVFALISLPLAVTTVVYFINHRYSGTPLWNLQDVPGMHSAVWALSFVSFFFLYPSTFNILEVAAVDKPKLHLWETGIMRVTRHPQVREGGCMGRSVLLPLLRAAAWCAVGIVVMPWRQGAATGYATTQCIVRVKECNAVRSDTALNTQPHFRLPRS
jgi:hypothetical protein